MKKIILPKVIAVVGPTSSGKSDLAVKIAKKYDGEVISADSRQVYVGLNLGTGKITKKEMAGVPHHLLDVVNPKKRFTVSDYKILADQAIAEIISRDRLPIICGGTGFYVDNVIDNITLPDVPVNNELRKKLAKKSSKQLFKTLEKVDSRRAAAIGEHNKIRLIRALEIIKSLGTIPELQSEPKYNTLSISITVDQDTLKDKIHNRLISRIEQGMITEAKKLHAEGLSWKRMEELGLEYRYLALFLQNKISKQEMLAQLELAICQYAKRQRQWFKRNQNIHWLQPKKTIEKAEMHAVINKFLY